MIRRPPRSTRTYTLFPYTTLFRSTEQCLEVGLVGNRIALVLVGQEVDRAPGIVGLLLAPADRYEHRRGADAGIDPGDRLDRAVRGLDPHPLAVADPERGRAVGLHLRIKRSEEHTSELQSLMRISYAVFCLKKKKT